MTVSWLVFLLGLILYEPRKAKSLKSCFVIQGKRAEHKRRNEGHLGLVSAFRKTEARGWMPAAVLTLPGWHREGPMVQVRQAEV